MQFAVKNFDPDVKIVVSENLDLKENEVAVCLGFVQGNNHPEKVLWKTISFSTKGLKDATFNEELVEIVSIILRANAKHYGWTDGDDPSCMFYNPNTSPCRTVENQGHQK